MTNLQRKANNFAVEVMHWVKSERLAWERKHPGKAFRIGKRWNSTPRLESLFEDAEQLIGEIENEQLDKQIKS